MIVKIPTDHTEKERRTPPSRTPQTWAITGRTDGTSPRLCRPMASNSARCHRLTLSKATA